MFSIFLLNAHARILACLKNHRGVADRLRGVLLFFRKLKIPVYKNLYDTLNFRSYYTVLKRVLESQPGGVYFEWGPGLNTEMAKQNMKEVYSVEHDKYWYDRYGGKTVLIYSPISSESCRDYPEEIKKLGKKVDIAFVDGRCRTQCIRACKEAGVPLVIMHDSLHPFDFVPAADSADPVSNEGLPYAQGFREYLYFVEVVDFRTIVLMNNEQECQRIVKLFGDFYTRSGMCQDYLKYYSHVA